MDMPNIIVIDQTIREGMQFRGLMFSYEERLKIISFQESLGIDISQVAYPSAHESEKKMLGRLYKYTSGNGFQIRLAGLGRALTRDIDQIKEGGPNDIHLTVVLNQNGKHHSIQPDTIFDELRKAVNYARSEVKNACIGVSILDIGKTHPNLLKRCAHVLIHELKIDILTLPDTSGIMSPNLFYDKVHEIAGMAKGQHTLISVHCHNDMGMATANTIMGVVAGARVIETTALGIGERNGIGDTFLAGKLLKDQGYKMNLRIENIEGFREYYEYVNHLCLEKINTSILNYHTPFFGRSIKTHVAGTHGKEPYGLGQGDDWYLNVLCGRHLVKNYLTLNKIEYNDGKLWEIVQKIKDRSVKLGRSIKKEEVKEIVADT